MIAGYIPRDTLTAIRESLISIFADTLAGHYEGFLGVDQMICQAVSPVFIPVSEINLRMTMGLIARNRYDEEKSQNEDARTMACENQYEAASRERQSLILYPNREQFCIYM